MRTLPFTHMVQLKSNAGILTKIRGLFDDGALVNSLCKSTYKSLQTNLGRLTPSRQQLHMANGTVVPSTGRWMGNVHLGSWSLKTSFEVFPSGGGWSILVGKPLLEQLKAIHDHATDTIRIPRDDGTYDVLPNRLGRTTKGQQEHPTSNQMKKWRAKKRKAGSEEREEEEEQKRKKKGEDTKPPGRGPSNDSGR